MKERPIIFSTEMVRAILDGRKTQTRRPHAKAFSINHPLGKANCPYHPGTKLWVKETFQYAADMGLCHKDDDYIIYRADTGGEEWKENLEGWRWRSPGCMPKIASRITLEITATRVERIQQITSADIKAEGVSLTLDYGPIYQHEFAQLWNSMYAKKGFGWEVNPWVWVISFRRIS